MGTVSCFIQVDDMEVWNPSNRVARVFLGQVEVLSRNFSTLSGAGEIVDDECRIDGVIFAHFASVLVREHQASNNRTLRALLEAVIGVSLVLLDRAGLAVDGFSPEAEIFWREHTQKLSHSMPR